ncbi:MAG TPA: hypothetical protein VEJ63_13060 [Planctomycetota bacterium]|nr:hypothetical protein [Planctomycetota bacterium]
MSTLQEFATRFSRRTLILPPLVFLGVAVPCWLFFGTSPSAATNEPEASEWIPVQRGDFEILWRDEGELRPVKVTGLTFQRWGKLSFIVAEGTSVKKGDRLLGLESRDQEEQHQHAQQDLTTQQKNLLEQQQNRDLEIKRLETELQAERDRVDVARLKEKEVLSKPTDLDKASSQNALDGARTRLTAAKAAFEAFEPLAAKGFGNQTELESKRIALRQAEFELERAEMKHKIVMGGALPEDKKRAALDRENVEIGLKLKELDFEDQVDNLNARVAAAQRDVDATQRRVDRLKEQVDRSSVYAPHDGIVVHRPTGRNNSKKVEVGENVGPWAMPIELPSYDKMKVRTQVPESFVRRIQARSETGTDGKPPRKGSFARVSVKTLPDKIYEGETIWIDGWARDKNSKLSDADVKAQGLSGVRVFDVEVELKESDPQRLREGFRATVEFPVETLKDVIWVPIRAVNFREGKPQVEVRKGDGKEPRVVELGAKSVDRVVITSGLSEGDVVYVPKNVQQSSKSGEEPGKTPAAGAAQSSGGASSPAGSGSRGGGGGGGGGSRRGGGGGSR